MIENGLIMVFEVILDLKLIENDWNWLFIVLLVMYYLFISYVVLNIMKIGWISIFWMFLELKMYIKNDNLLYFELV